jgi:hypothetical protein
MSVLRLPPNPFPQRISANTRPYSAHRHMPPRPHHPHPNQKSHTQRRQQKNHHRRNPRNIIKPAANRRRQHRSSILRRKPVQDRSVRSTTIHLRVQFANHHWRNRAPNVVALQQHLSTPARADHLVPYLVEPRRRIRPQHRHRQQTDNSSLHPSPESKAKHDEPLPPPATPTPPAPAPHFASCSAPVPRTSLPPQSTLQSISNSSADSETL